eukprot:gene54513-17675_t
MADPITMPPAAAGDAAVELVEAEWAAWGLRAGLIAHCGAALRGAPPPPAEEAATAAGA